MMSYSSFDNVLLIWLLLYQAQEWLARKSLTNSPAASLEYLLALLPYSHTGYLPTFFCWEHLVIGGAAVLVQKPQTSLSTGWQDYGGWCTKHISGEWWPNVFASILLSHKWHSQGAQLEMGNGVNCMGQGQNVGRCSLTLSRRGRALLSE